MNATQFGRVRRPGVAAVGEGELLVVDVDAVVVAIRSELTNRGDVLGARRWISENRGHLTGRQCVDDRGQHIDVDALDGVHELGCQLRRRVRINDDLVDADGVEPER